LVEKKIVELDLFAEHIHRMDVAPGIRPHVGLWRRVDESFGVLGGFDGINEHVGFCFVARPVIRGVRQRPYMVSAHTLEAGVVKITYAVALDFFQYERERRRSSRRPRRREFGIAVHRL
jgi:hypothetical protein